MDEFKLKTEKKGLLVYLLITLAVPAVLIELYNYAVGSGMLNVGSTALKVLTLIVICVTMLIMLILGYFLIFLKNHEITVRGGLLENHIYLFNKTVTVQLREVKSVKRGFLGALVLKDENGKTLLTVEKSMTNFEQFEEFLRANNVRS